jgi:CheY-like chemotaxis protein
VETPARIAIAEPSPEVRTLIEAVVRELGHEPVAVEPGGELPPCDVLVAEPGSPLGRDAAARLRAERPGTPLVLVSIYPRGPETAALAPAAHLLKPFRLADLEAALRDAVAGATR